MSIIKHLLPTARAWRITVNSTLKRFLSAFNIIDVEIKNYCDLAWLDIFPSSTRALLRWEKIFGLKNTITNEQQRRDRLTATWRALGGQSPYYIQNTLQDSGFPVFVHEWWEIGSVHCGEPSVQCGEPSALCSGGYLQQSTLLVQCGEPLIQCGEAIAQCGNSSTKLFRPAINPNTVLAPDNILRISGKGYPLVNIITEITPGFEISCGEPLVQCGEPTAQCGNKTDLFWA